MAAGHSPGLMYMQHFAMAASRWQLSTTVEIRELLEKTKSVYDVAQRKALFKEIQKVVLDDAANIWIYQMPATSPKPQGS